MECRVHEFGYGVHRWILDGIVYLNRLGSKVTCHLQPGPAKCNRVACTRLSGIYACNYRNTSVHVKAREIAKMTRAILDVCAKQRSLDSDVQGKMWHKDGGWFLAVGITEHGCNRSHPIIDLPKWIDPLPG
jgi:hypothetical protein